ncbi:MAG: hypothetical protein PHY02_09575 [Phycisphaerae bacterium]|nr:hypothetical protein [Phycisphaerae bacterium]
MGEMELYQRNQLPAAGGGGKPPYRLAGQPTDRSGQIRFGQTLAGFSGNIFEKLIETRANNEHHEFLGKVSTAQAEFEGFVRANPGAPLEDIQKAKQKMLTDIDTAGQSSQTNIAKEANKNFLLLNREKIEKQADGEVGAIVMRHEEDKFNIQRQIYLKTGNKAALANLYKRHTESGFLDKETAEIAYKADTIYINTELEKAQKKQDENTALSLASSIGGKEGLKWLLDEKNTPQLDTDQKKSVISSYNFFEKQKQKSQTLNIEKMQDDIAARLNEPDAVKLLADIDSLPDDPARGVNSKNWYKEVVLNRDKYQTDLDVKMDLQFKIDMNEPITKNDIREKLGRGLSVADEQWLEKRLTDSQGDKRYSQTVKFALENLKKLKTTGEFISGQLGVTVKPEDQTITESLQNQKIFSAIYDEFIQWVDEHPDAKTGEITAKYQSLVEPTQNQAALGWWTNLWSYQILGHRLISILGDTEEQLQVKRNAKFWNQLLQKNDDEVLAEIAKLPTSVQAQWKIDKKAGSTPREFLKKQRDYLFSGVKTPYKIGDKKTINGTTYTYNGKEWVY